MTQLQNGVPLHDTACGRSLDDHLDSVSQLLPVGRAWPRDPESTLMKFWTAFSDTVKYVDDRICQLADEFFCSTASETLEVWYEQYGLDLERPQTDDVDAACIQPGWVFEDTRRLDLCAAVVRQGEATEAYLTQTALDIGYVITVVDMAGETPVVTAGCLEAGCSQLGTTPVARTIGSGLGRNIMGIEPGPHCRQTGGSFWFAGGSGHHFRITIDWDLTLQNLQARSPWATYGCQAGCFYAGDACAPLRGDLGKQLIETLNKVKPAHTTTVVAWA